MHGVWWRVTSRIIQQRRPEQANITPMDMLAGRQQEIHAERDRHPYAKSVSINSSTG